ncbi:MAG: alanine/glycine:cation symporter family protein [Bacteroidales bacterium]|nr:alanine/glycine:cation symporter family protein [Bacteroidales bacterium]
MEQFSAIVNDIDGLIWSMPLVFLCLGAGLYLSIRLGFPQIRHFGEMIRLLSPNSGDKAHRGISSFQAFATTVGARVGMGNIAGIASAIYFGGPGSIFWMWIIALIGAASAFTESTLGQAFKIKGADGHYVGGPAHYIEKGLKCKPYAIVFAIVAVLGPGLLMPGVQINSLVIVFEEAFSVNRVLVGVICCIFLAVVVAGGVKRIAQIAVLLTPFMCIIYIALAVIILVINFTQIPTALALIVTSAIGVQPVFGAIVGSAISWGVKRGIYSNEAGMGCGAIVSAAVDCSHPAKQGLIQACSIYADTLLVGTATALIVILTGTYDVVDGAGVLLLDQTSNMVAGGIENGIKWTQYALMTTYGDWCGKLLAVIIVLFVFTSMTGYCYQAEANMSYLTRGSKAAIWVCRGLFVLASLFGALVEADAIWAMGDIGYGLLAWANIVAICLLAPKAKAMLDDYVQQKKEGKDPQFDPAKFGIEDETGAWSHIG